METISKDEFQLWKDHVVTKEIFIEIESRIQDAKDILGSSAGLAPDQDRYICGLIKAYEEILSVTVEGM